MIQLIYSKKPNFTTPMASALLAPRKGFNVEKGLPAIYCVWKTANFDTRALNKYLSVLDIRHSNYLPVLYPHVLAGSLHMHMLTHPEFPIKLVGALHLKNRIQQIKRIPLDVCFNIECNLGGYRLVRKGLEFDFYTYLKSEKATYWQEVSTYFVEGNFGDQQKHAHRQSFELENVQENIPGESWYIPKDRGKSYAQITGDYNPIHTSKQLAKLFGFKRDIAHGFGVLAQAIDKVAPKTNDKIDIDVIFKGPIYLEKHVRINQSVSAGRFDIYCEGNHRPSICVNIN